MENVRKWAIGYYALQGFGVAVWWLTMYLAPETSDLFRLETGSFVSLNAFWLGDLLLIAPGSIVAATLLYLRSTYALPVAWLVTGAIAQATFYTFAYTLQTDLGWLGVALMLPALVWSGVFVTGLTTGQQMFRKSKPASARYILFKTFSQIVVVWTLILALIPLLIVQLEDKLGIVRIAFPLQRPVAMVLFVTISLLGVWAAVVMSKTGKGTPLPLDHATDLVISGPYRFVRNPMALSGIGQGLAVALFLGSPLVAIYAFMGSAIWQVVFRPLEEDDLECRFGDEFNTYRSQVRCWIPRRSPFQSIRPL